MQLLDRILLKHSVKVNIGSLDSCRTISVIGKPGQFAVNFSFYGPTGGQSGCLGSVQGIFVKERNGDHRRLCVAFDSRFPVRTVPRLESLKVVSVCVRDFFEIQEESSVWRFDIIIRKGKLRKSMGHMAFQRTFKALIKSMLFHDL